MKASLSTRLPLLAAMTLALGLAAAPVSAAAETRGSAPSGTGRESVAQLNEEGASLYAARDYRRAIEKFIQAYAIDNDPNLLFNIARCYEELGEVDASIEKYERFLEMPGADARGRQRARESLQVLRNLQGGQREVAPASSSGAAPSATSGGSADAPPAGDGASYLPWVVLGGSVAAAAAGTTVYILGAGDHSRVTEAQGYGEPGAVSSMTRREAEELVSSGDTKKLIGGISLGVAGALAVTYVVLLASGDAPPAEQPSLAFDLAPTGSTVSLRGSF